MLLLGFLLSAKFKDLWNKEAAVPMQYLDLPVGAKFKDLQDGRGIYIQKGEIDTHKEYTCKHLYLLPIDPNHSNKFGQRGYKLSNVAFYEVAQMRRGVITYGMKFS